MSTLAGTLRERLRAATAEAHHALERDLDWKARIATLSGYRGLLAGLYGFHAGYEPAIARALADDEFFGPRRRLARLAADLRALGLDRCERAALPVAIPIALDGPAAALGALYVLEGSTLGGLVVRKALARRHGVGIADAYYRGHGRATAAFWGLFCEELERRCTDAACERAALAAGTATFEALSDWLVPGVVSPTPDDIARLRLSNLENLPGAALR